MLSLRVMVAPMHKAALPIPYIFSQEADLFARLQLLDPGGKIDIVGDKHRVMLVDSDDESLMRRAVQIIWQDADYGAGAFNQNIAALLAEGFLDGPWCCRKESVVVLVRWKK